MPRATNFSGCSMGSSTTSRIFSICRTNRRLNPSSLLHSWALLVELCQAKKKIEPLLPVAFAAPAEGDMHGGLGQRGQ